MLGRYENFPQNIHGVTLFELHNHTKSLQQAIFCSFTRLNNETFDLANLTPYLKQSVEVGFEFGVADGFNFNFLDQTELELCLKTVEVSELETLDFFFTVRYHLLRDGKHVPLRFDYNVLRFVFLEDVLELRIRHEKGTRRVHGSAWPWCRPSKGTSCCSRCPRRSPLSVGRSWRHTGRSSC